MQSEDKTMGTLINYLLPTLLGLLGTFLSTFIVNLRESRVDNEEFYNLVLFLVERVELEQGRAPSDIKRGMVKRWIREAGTDVAESLLNTMIELAVQELHKNKKIVKDPNVSHGTDM